MASDEWVADMALTWYYESLVPGRWLPRMGPKLVRDSDDKAPIPFHQSIDALYSFMQLFDVDTVRWYSTIHKGSDVMTVSLLIPPRIPISRSELVGGRTYQETELYLRCRCLLNAVIGGELTALPERADD